MHHRHYAIPASLRALIDAESARTGRSADGILRDALSQYFAASVHTVFQVSTTGALVAGVSDRDVSVATLLDHGDFGLGTFTSLDGEMILIDGHAYRADADGQIAEVAGDAGTPFAIVTRFAPEREATIGPVHGFEGLESCCDTFRASGNIFYALRLDGRFARVKARSIGPQPPGTRLAEAAKGQHEFVFDDIEGALVGIWSPDFSGPFSVAGYHFHFISADRRHGGHLLDVEAGRLRLQIEPLSNFHLALPETEAYLKATIGGNTDDELQRAERGR